MQLPWCLQLCALALLFNFQLTTSYALPSHGSPALHANDLHPLQAHSKIPRASGDRINTSPALSPRVSVEEIGFQSFLKVGDGWNLYYSSYHASSLPIQPAAWALTKLYASMLIQAQTTWNKGAPQNVISMVLGQIQLIMICPDKPIPWAMVEKFASEMLRVTGDGWTGLYQLLLSRAAEEVNIGIQLTILPATLKRPRPWQ